MTKIKGSYVVGAVIAIGLFLYFFSKRKVGGTVTAMESGASVTYSKNVDGRTMVPGAEQGTVDFGTEGM